MADLLSLFRGTKPTGTTPRTTPTRPITPEAEKPTRSAEAPYIAAGTTYDVVVPLPNPILDPMPTMFPPGSSGSNSGLGGPGADTTGWYFLQSSNGVAVPALPPTFFVLQATTNPKTTEDGPLADRLYRLFTKGRE